MISCCRENCRFCMAILIQYLVRNAGHQESPKNTSYSLIACHLYTLIYTFPLYRGLKLGLSVSALLYPGTLTKSHDLEDAQPVFSLTSRTVIGFFSFSFIMQNVWMRRLKILQMEAHGPRYKYSVNHFPLHSGQNVPGYIISWTPTHSILAGQV